MSDNNLYTHIQVPPHNTQVGAANSGICHRQPQAEQPYHQQQVPRAPVVPVLPHANTNAGYVPQAPNGFYAQQVPNYVPQTGAGGVGWNIPRIARTVGLGCAAGFAGYAIGNHGSQSHGTGILQRPQFNAASRPTMYNTQVPASAQMAYTCTGYASNGQVTCAPVNYNPPRNQS